MQKELKDKEQIVKSIRAGTTIFSTTYIAYDIQIFNEFKSKNK